MVGAIIMAKMHTARNRAMIAEAFVKVDFGWTYFSRDTPGELRPARTTNKNMINIIKVPKPCIKMRKMIMFNSGEPFKGFKKKLGMLRMFRFLEKGFEGRDLYNRLVGEPKIKIAYNSNEVSQRVARGLISMNVNARGQMRSLFKGEAMKMNVNENESLRAVNYRGFYGPPWN